MAITITRGFEPGGDRYKYDFRVYRHFAQMDTSEDASYYGNWANAETLELFGFMEGDTVHKKCDTVEEFRQEVLDFVEFCDRAGIKFLGIDPGPRHTPEVLKPWQDAGLAHLIH